MISILLICISGICYAVTECLGIMFYESIFYRFICWKNEHREQWWNGSVSWKNKYKNGLMYRGRKYFSFFNIKVYVPSMFFSATELFKTLHVIFILFSISLYKQITNSFLLDFFILFLIWNSSMMFFRSIFVR